MRVQNANLLVHCTKCSSLKIQFVNKEIGAQKIRVVFSFLIFFSCLLFYFCFMLYFTVPVGWWVVVLDIRRTLCICICQKKLHFSKFLENGNGKICSGARSKRWRIDCYYYAVDAFIVDIFVFHLRLLLC